MQIADILTIDRINCGVHAASKKRALELLSELIGGSLPALSPRAVFDCLLSRERLGSTGLGFGVAIPHGRVADLQETVGAFVKLQEAVDFDAVDGKPVDLMFGLLVPEHCADAHLQILAQLAENFADESLRERLRARSSAEEAFELLAHAVPQP